MSGKVDLCESRVGDDSMCKQYKDLTSFKYFQNNSLRDSRLPVAMRALVALTGSGSWRGDHSEARCVVTTIRLRKNLARFRQELQAH
jgi:hypothetical protein